MNRGDSPFQIRGKFEYALRVLRLYTAPSLGAEGTRESVSPPGVLRRAFEEADSEYDKLLSTIDPKYYHEFAIPTHLDIEEETVRTLLSSLRLSQTSPGVLGPENIQHMGRLYKVWILTFPCG